MKKKEVCQCDEEGRRKKEQKEEGGRRMDSSEGILEHS